MLFNSYEFIFVFLPITLFIYFYLNHKRLTKASNFFLVLSSLFFYSWWNIAYLPLILGSIAFNFSIGRLLGLKPTKSILTIGVIGNISLLGYFKYTDLLTSNVKTPIIKSNRFSAWAQFTVKVNNRDTLQARLKNNGIPTAVYYPMSLHLQECFQYLNCKQGDFPISEKASNEVMSLPMNPFLVEEEVWYISKCLEPLIGQI